MKITNEIYEFFVGHLNDNGVEYESDQHFVDHVTEAFLQHQKEARNLPKKFESDVREEIAAEVLDILRKTTYGYFSLKEFKIQKKAL